MPSDHAFRATPPVDLTVPLKDAVHSSSPEVLTGTASDPALTEDLALILLRRSELPAQAIDQLSKNAGLMQSRKVKLAVVEHPRTPRHISIPAVRHLFSFDLMHVALSPAVPADIKIAAEESLINRLERLSSGERLSLARRASDRVAGELLLLDPEPRVIRAALENSRLTEAGVVKALLRRDSPAILVAAVCRHSKWSPRREIRVALLRSDKTPLARVLEFAHSLPAASVREIMRSSHLPAAIKASVLKEVEGRGHDRESWKN